MFHQLYRGDTVSSILQKVVNLSLDKNGFQVPGLGCKGLKNRNGSKIETHEATGGSPEPVGFGGPPTNDLKKLIKLLENPLHLCLSGAHQ